MRVLDHGPNGFGDPVGVGVIGLGYWGPNLVRNLHELPEANVVSVCDPREEALNRISRRYPRIRRRKRLETVLRDRLVEAVAIATPVGTHYPIARAALEAGKHVFVEKPLALSSEEAEDLVSRAQRLHRVLMVGHTFLYSPAVNLIRDLIRSDELGEIYFISMSRVNLGIHQPDVSVVWDLGPHDCSILQYWLGETPNHAQAVSRGCIMPAKPDVAFVNLEFPSGTIANLELSWLAPSKLRRTTIVASRKMIVYDDTSLEAVRVFDSGVMSQDPQSFGEFQLSYRTGDIVSPRLDPVEPLYLEMQDFCRAVRGKSDPRASGDLGLEVVRTIEAVDRSLKLGGVPIAIEPAVIEAVG